MTTSLQRPASEGSRRRSAELPGEVRTPANGIPRSAFFRAPRTLAWTRWFTAALVILDLGAAILGSYTARASLPQAAAGFAPEGHPVPVWFDVVAYTLLPLTWVIVIWANGAYDRRYLGLGTDEFKRIIRAGWTTVAIVSFLSLTLKANLSRLGVATALVSALAYIMIFRLIARQVLYALRTHGRWVHRVLLVGALPEALEVHAAISRNRKAGLAPVGVHLAEGYASARGGDSPLPVYANRDLVGLVRELGADTIAVCGSAGSDSADLRRLAWQLEGTGIDLVVAPQLTDIAGPRVHIRPVEGLPLLHVEEPTLSGVGWLVKNTLDRLAALIGLVLLSPLFLVIAIAIKRNDPKGPVFFRQTRLGHQAKTFRVWKFRTMYVDAEERLATLVDQNENDGLLFKIKDDPRVTPPGRWLRRTSLDELPQLINVLVGEMSLVGPRPLPAEDGDFLGDVRRRMLVRPGMTGLWQVSGRSDLSWDDAVRLDLYYVDNWSLTTDLKILWQTVGVVLAHKGAY